MTTFAGVVPCRSLQVQREWGLMPTWLPRYEVQVRLVVEFGAIWARAADSQPPAGISAGHSGAGRAVDVDFAAAHDRPALGRGQ